MSLLITNVFQILIKNAGEHDVDELTWAVIQWIAF